MQLWKGLYSMGRYIGGQIILGTYTYEYAITKWPQYKVAIDAYLAEKGWSPTETGQMVAHLEA